MVKHIIAWSVLISVGLIVLAAIVSSAIEGDEHAMAFVGWTIILSVVGAIAWAVYVVAT